MQSHLSPEDFVSDEESEWAQFGTVFGDVDDLAPIALLFVIQVWPLIFFSSLVGTEMLEEHPCFAIVF